MITPPRWFSGIFERWITAPIARYELRIPNDLNNLRKYIEKGDVILVEGDQRISQIIKYLTQSCWSHAGLYIGDELLHHPGPFRDLAIQKYGEDGARHLFIEATIEDGVTVAPLNKYIHLNIRVCRPFRIEAEDLQIVLDTAIDHLGFRYDTRNLVDLARYLLPVKLIPSRLGRKALAFGSGSPTETICSAMLARAFHKARFPVVPHTASVKADESILGRFFEEGDRALRQVFSMQDPTLVVPRDYDLSPYFQVVKFNMIEGKLFRYKHLVWQDQVEQAQREASVRAPAKPGDLPQSD